MLGVDDVLKGGRCCIGLIRLISLIGLILFVYYGLGLIVLILLFITVTGSNILAC